jgi:factor associated with neutral sphingomyelinase activation
MSRRPRHRFSPLMLDFGESYLFDRAVIMSPSSELAAALVLRGARKRKARLKVATWSLTLVPDDADVPLLRVLLKASDISAAPQADCFEVRCSSVLHKLESYQPFRTAAVDGVLTCTMLHASLADFLSVVGSLHEACRLPDALARARRAQVGGVGELASFDLTELVDPLEGQLTELRVLRVTPMLSTPAIFLLTERRIYVQTAASVAGSPVSHWPLSALRRAVRRRYLMSPRALELEFECNTVHARGASSEPPSLLLVLRSHEEREHILAELESARGRLHMPPLPPPPIERLREQTDRWRHGRLSNFDYLMYLNDCAGRSFNDLAQYPVMPWVLSDYQSATLDLEARGSFRDLAKPIGALNEERLAMFRERYESLPPEDRFMYGTHYSAPGFVSYFLLRQQPELTLHLHGGRFDESDRLFYSMRESWTSVMHSTSDVKELIPEFFMPELHETSVSSFLCNAHGLELGVRQDIA